MRHEDLDRLSVEGVAARLVSWAAEDHCVKWPIARALVAREAGIAPGSLERLEGRRLKFVDRIAGRLNALLLDKIDEKIAELEHIRAVAIAIGNRTRPVDLVRLDAALAEARKAVGRD